MVFLAGLLAMGLEHLGMQDYGEWETSQQTFVFDLIGLFGSMRD